MALNSSQVNKVLAAIEEDYVDPVSRTDLMRVCMSAAGEKQAVDADAPLEQFNRFLQKLDGTSAEGANPTKDCIMAMVRSLDASATYLDGDRYMQLKSAPPGEGAIGIEMLAHAKGVAVVSAIDGSPGARAGLRQGDVVMSIAQNPLQGKDLAHAAQLLRGPIGSTVELVIQREGEPTLLSVRIVREPVKLQSVHAKLFGDGVAYVRVSSFASETLGSLTTNLIDLRKRSPNQLRGVILDLRNCSGGLLATTVGLASAFLPQGSRVVELQGRAVTKNLRYLNAELASYTRGHERDPLKDLPEDIKSVPLIVLTNGKTGSGAEMVTAALQDHKRATIVGADTFKHSAIDTIYPIDSASALRITTARAYRPSGNPIHGAGITPDVVLNSASGSIGAADDTVLQHALGLLSTKK